MHNRKYRAIHWILGDQLNASHSWYESRDDSILFVIAEIRQETDYVRHHVQKLCAFFAAMSAFARHLEEAGHNVLHLTLDDTADYRDLSSLINALCKRHGSKEFVYQRPDEFRLAKQFEALTLPDGTRKLQADSEHFLLPYEDIQDHFSAGIHLRMESFYRKMRRRFIVLMDGDEPRGGKWNYDSENRNRIQAEDLADVPAPLEFTNAVDNILARLKRHEVATFGEESTSLLWPVSREQALKLLDFFCSDCLPRFGKYQDAMTCNSEHGWSLYHSRLSFALNAKMLSPREVIDKALARFEDTESNISLPQIEGFVRQILGWREYIRGVYWANMPGYAGLNHFSSDRKLPDFFWTGNTQMRCMQASIEQSLSYSYAHHIQRLMVTGNFSLLAGLNPDEVDAWYLGIYIDALEWVELPNTRGMALFADGGLIATKPYAASGNYINKMSDYCKACHYKVKEKTGDRACPFNSLYWNFMHSHRHELGQNHRTGMLFSSWDRKNDSEREAILRQARKYLENIESL